MMYKKGLFVLLAWFSALLAVADDDVVFTASAPPVVTLGQQFRVDYTLNREGRDLQVPSMADFDVLMGPSTSRSSSVQWINGKVTNSTQLRYTYVLVGGTVGTFTLAPASIMVDGKKYTTRPLTIKVIEEGGQEAGGVTSDHSAASSRGEEAAVSRGDKTDQIFVRAVLSRPSVYEQEAVLLTYKLYTRYDMRDITNVKFPEYKDFYAQEIDLGQDRSWVQEEYNGKLYNCIVLKQSLLFPQQAGRTEIEGGKFDAVIRLRTNNRPRSVFDNFFDSYQEVRKTVTIPSVRLDVKALPKPAPAGFSGAVGQFSMNSEASASELNVNDALTVKVNISGNGNLKLIKPLDIRFPDDFEVYDPKIDRAVKTGAGGMTGTLTVEYVAIPRFGGDFEVPSADFVYFDVKSGKYKTLSTPAYSLNVKGSAGETAVVAPSGAGGVVKESVRNLGSDIRYIHPQNDLRPSGERFFRTAWYWLCYVIPSSLFLAALLFARRRARENADAATRKNRRANKLARKRLRAADARLHESDSAGFHEETARALWGYVSDKLNIPAASLTKDNVRSLLLERGAGDELATEFLDTLSECEYARFAPAGGSGPSMKALFDRAVSLIARMDNQLR